MRKIKFLPAIYLTIALLASVLFLSQIQSQKTSRSPQGLQDATNVSAKDTTSEPEYVPGEIIVKLKSDVPALVLNNDAMESGKDLSKSAVFYANLDLGSIPDSIKELNKQYVIREIEKVFKNQNTRRVVKSKLGETRSFDFSKVYVIRFDPKQSIEDVENNFKNSTDLEYVEPNYTFKISAIPSDPEFVTQWGLHNTGQSSGKVGADISAPEAWDIETGDRSILVGIIDTGIDYAHPDLINAIWNNTGETGLDISGNDKRYNQIDDDTNGYVDDWRGWDFFNDDNDPLDDHGHGTHVAGIIGATGNNNISISGVAWDSSLVGLKFLSQYGYGDATDAAEAIVYATNIGAKITNNSWGGAYYSGVLFDAIQYSRYNDDLVVAAAGNGSRNTDIYGNYPSSYDIDNILSVAITDHNDNFFPVSNYGLNSVDLAAPGKKIYSLRNGGGGISQTGTSMSTPFVTGAALLLWSQNNDLTYLNIRNRILLSVDPLPTLHGRMATGGRLNIKNLLTTQYNGLNATPGQLDTYVFASKNKDVSLLLINNSDNTVEWRLNDGLPSWIQVSVTEGNIAPNESYRLTISLRTNNLPIDTYQSTISIQYNERDTINIPVTMEIQPYHQAEWIQSVGGPSYENGKSVDIDSENNIVEVGRYDGPLTIGNFTLACEGDADIFFVKYNAQGNVMWAKRIGGTGGNMSDRPEFVNIDKDDNIYVSGEFNTNITFDTITLTTGGPHIDNIFLAKYDSQGNILWAKNIGSKSVEVKGSSIIKDSTTTNEYLYLAGEYFGTVLFDGTTLTSRGQSDVFLAKYNSSGVMQWIRSAGASEGDECTDITTDNNGTYLTGSYMNMTTFDNINLNSHGGKDIFIAKYNHSGDIAWAKTIGGYEYENGGVLTTNSQGNILVTGHYYGPTYFDDKVLEEGYGDIFLANYSTSGTVNWVKAITYPSSGLKKVMNMLVDHSDNIYISGSYENTLLFDIFSLTSIQNGDFDSFITKLTNVGKIEWTKSIFGYGGTYANGFASDNNNNLYVVGGYMNFVYIDDEFHGSQGGGDAMLIKLRPFENAIASPTPSQVPTITPTPTLPVAVFLEEFSVQWINEKQVRIDWVTTAELNNIGFNLWRGTSPRLPTTKLNKQIIPSCSPGGTQGCTYHWLDTVKRLSNEAPYYYWLEDIDTSGRITRHGPVSTDGSGGP